MLVVAAVIERDGRLLACRRNPERAAGGRWEFPGGKVEEGESPREALKRELREELAVDVVVAEELSTDDTVVEGQLIRLQCFKATLVAHGPIHSSDHDRLEWITRPLLSTLEWAEPDLPIVALLSGS